ncbi:MAG: ABC transporter ATP-binding protein [Bacilli bacterium]|nr:ABC transporter ATP-binding protein [Bacilli bacterium]
MSVISINNLKKSFGKTNALKGISFEINKGEIFGFIGPNGAGKSTTIRCLLGLIKADEGTCMIEGLDGWQESVLAHEKIAYVPGDVNLWPNLTGGQIIDVLLSFKNKKHTKKTDELIKLFDFDASKKARSYSKGNRQKVALIAALSSDADIYIFDEPTSGLDPLMEQVFQDYVLKLKDEGKTILLSSHILSEVEKLCDQIAIIKEGNIIEIGSLKDMQHLTRTNFEIISDIKIDGLENIKGLHNIKQEDNNLKVQVDTNNIDAFMKHINQYHINYLTSSAPTLEDLFLRYYEKEGA